MTDSILITFEPRLLWFVWPVLLGFILLWAILSFCRRRSEPSTTPNSSLKDAKDTIIMALLDDIAAQTAAVEATEAAALAKIDDLKAQVATAQADAASAQAALAAAQGDVAAAQALADRLRVANDALAAKVAA